MASLELNPEPYIYSPPLAIIGGVKVTSYDKTNTLLKDLSGLIKQINDSLYQAYEIKSLLYVEQNIIKNTITPLVKTLDDKCSDYTINGLLKKALNQVIKSGRKQAILLSETSDQKINQFYYIQILDKEHDPELSKNMLLAVQATAVTLSLEKAIIKGSITNDSIVTRVELKIIK